MRLRPLAQARTSQKCESLTSDFKKALKDPNGMHKACTQATDHPGVHGVCAPAAKFATKAKKFGSCRGILDALQPDVKKYFDQIQALKARADHPDGVETQELFETLSDKQCQ